MEETKNCCRCGKCKTLNAFVSKRNCCKLCHAARGKEWRKNNIELNRRLQFDFYHTVTKLKTK